MKLLFKNIPIFLLAGVMLLLPVKQGIADASDWQDADMARTRLLSFQTGTEGREEILLGVQVQLKKGWKTYWRSPGDSGLPPVFSWQEGSNIQAVAVEWPRPFAFDSFGIQSWGYKSEVIFPVRVTLEKAGQPVQANLQFSYGVCEQVCVPLKQDLALFVPANGDGLSAHAPLIQGYLDLVPPRMAAQSRVETISAMAAGERDLEITIQATEPFQAPTLILEGEDGDFFDVSRPVIEVTGKTSIFRVKADVVDTSIPLKGREVVVTVLDKGLSLEERIQIK